MRLSGSVLLILLVGLAVILGELLWPPALPAINLNVVHTQVAVTTATTVVLAARTDRRLLILVNDDDTAIYCNISGGAAVAARGIRINANGGTLYMDSYTPDAAVNCIHSATGTKSLLVTEGWPAWK